MRFYGSLLILFLLVSTVFANELPLALSGLPSDGQVISSSLVSFTWIYRDVETTPQKGFLIEVSDNYQFRNSLHYYGDGQPSFKTALPTQGNYYWRIAVSDGQGYGPFSEAKYFYYSGTFETCKDGTLVYTCSGKQPYFCTKQNNELKFIENCDDCGCPGEAVCDVSKGTCSTTTCSDGTAYNTCSKSKPTYCVEGVLKDVCNLCGCAEGLECLSDGSCGLKEIQIVEVEKQVIVEAKPVKVRFIDILIDFFKNLFY